MDQLNLFGNATPPLALPPDLMEYHPGAFGTQQSLAIMRDFIATVPWQQQIIAMYGKQVVTPRLTAWYGDAGSDYAFSGTKFNPIPWTVELLQVKQTVEALTNTAFNSVLLNY